MLVDGPLQQGGPLPQTRVPMPLGAVAKEWDSALFVTGGQCLVRQMGKSVGIKAIALESRSFRSHKPSPAEPSASISAFTASRSTGVKSGCQQSKMKTIRKSSVGFIASCSMVSSNMNASPLLQ